MSCGMYSKALLGFVPVEVSKSVGPSGKRKNIDSKLRFVYFFDSGKGLIRAIRIKPMIAKRPEIIKKDYSGGGLLLSSPDLSEPERTNALMG